MEGEEEGRSGDGDDSLLEVVEEVEELLPSLENLQSKSCPSFNTSLNIANLEVLFIRQSPRVGRGGGGVLQRIWSLPS